MSCSRSGVVCPPKVWGPKRQEAGIEQGRRQGEGVMDFTQAARGAVLDPLELISQWEELMRRQRGEFLALFSRLEKRITGLEELLTGRPSSDPMFRHNRSEAFSEDDGNNINRGTTGYGHHEYGDNMDNGDNVYGETYLNGRIVNSGNVRSGRNVNGGSETTETVRYSSYPGHVTRSVHQFSQEALHLLETIQTVVNLPFDQVQTVVNHPFVQNLFRNLTLYGIASCRRCQVNSLLRTNIWNNTASMYMRSGRFKCKPIRSLDRCTSSRCCRSRRRGSDLVVRNEASGCLFLVRIWRRRRRRRDRLDGWSRADKYVTFGELWVKDVRIKESIFIHFYIK